jgi:hypothetical protein
VQDSRSGVAVSRCRSVVGVLFPGRVAADGELGGSGIVWTRLEHGTRRSKKQLPVFQKARDSEGPAVDIAKGGARLA